MGHNTYKEAVKEYHRIHDYNTFNRMCVYQDMVDKMWKLGHIGTHGIPQEYRAYYPHH